MDAKEGGSFKIEQGLNTVWCRREVQNDKDWKEPQYFAFGSSVLTSTKTPLHEVERARSSYCRMRVCKE